MTDSRRQLSKYTAIFAGGTMISRVSGLLRDIAMTAIIPGQPLAAFNIAFRLPNMLRDLVGEGASNAAFIPVLSETLEKDSKDAFREAVSALMSAMIVLLGTVTVLGVLFMPFIFHLLEPIGLVTKSKELPQEYVALIVSLTRWTFPYIFFIGLTVFQMAPLFVMRHYSTPSWSPSLLNIAQILVCIQCWYFPNAYSNLAWALVLGAWLGGIGQFLVQYLAVGKHVNVWTPNFHLRHPSIRTAFWLLVPVLLGQSAGEVNKMVDLLFATSFGDAAVNALFYANRLIQLPLSVFGIAISAAILPSISQAAARKDFEHVRETLIHGFRQSYFLICPALAALLVLPGPIIALLFERGHFTPENTAMTAAALAYFALGLLCFAWVKVAVAGFYAVQDTKTPVSIAFVSMLLNIVLIFILSRPMGFRGLALATTLSYSVNFILLYVMLCRRFGRLWNGPFLSALLRITCATVVAGVVFYLVYAAMHHYLPHMDLAVRAYASAHRHLPYARIIPRLIYVTGALGAGGILYFALCTLLRVPDASSFLSLLSKRK